MKKGLLLSFVIFLAAAKARCQMLPVLASLRKPRLGRVKFLLTLIVLVGIACPWGQAFAADSHRARRFSTGSCRKRSSWSAPPPICRR